MIQRVNFNLVEIRNRKRVSWSAVCTFETLRNIWRIKHPISYLHSFTPQNQISVHGCAIFLRFEIIRNNL